jgi:hypothetical protein
MEFQSQDDQDQENVDDSSEWFELTNYTKIFP